MSANDQESGPSAEHTSSAAQTVAETGDFKMSPDVKVDDAGPCKKHVRVRIPRSDIDHIYELTLGELNRTANVPGFRVGRAPNDLIKRRFRGELTDQVKQKILIDSMEQISAQNDLDPINEPEIDIDSLEIPESGDFEYEFDVEVRPQFDIPDYEGLTINRPVRKTTDSDIAAYTEKFLAQYGQLVPREEAAEAGDFVTLEMRFFHDDQEIHDIPELNARVRPVLRFRDAELEGFDKLMVGAKIDDEREADVTVSQEAESIELRGETVQISMLVLDIKRLKLPELNKEFLKRVGAESEEELRDEIRSMVERQVVYQQRQSARSQVLEKITESANWDLPEKLVRRQVENALRREVLEMQQAGFTSHDIQARENEIRQWAVTSTRQALKEHFVLDRIATSENIEVLPEDIEAEIKVMGLQRGEPARRVRARLEKSGMIENLKAQIRERKAVDFILERAKFVEVPMPTLDETRVEAVSHSVCGQTRESETELASD